MIPNALASALDLSKNHLQATDSNAEIIPETEPRGDFAALLQAPLEDAALPVIEFAGSDLPAAGNELPVMESGVPIPEPRAEFVAYFEGDEALSRHADRSDGVRTDVADDLVGSDETAIAATLAMNTSLPGSSAVAPPHLPGITGGANHRRDIRDLDNMAARTVNGRGFSRNDHGRMPLAQPMRPPERMIYKAAGEAGDLALNAVSAGTVAGREPAPGDLETVRPDRNNMGGSIAGLAPLDQVTRGAGEPLSAFELPVQKEGADALNRISTAVQAPAAAGHLSEAPHLRDLASVAKPTPVLATSIELPVTDDAWGDAFQDRVLLMAKGRIQHAEIRLNPAELGPIRVQVSVEDDAATLNFTALHNVTREAIEQAMPRLREMLSENGLTLAGSTVDDSNDREGNDKGGASQAGAATDAEQAHSDAGETATVDLRRVDSSSLVDTFA